MVATEQRIIRSGNKYNKYFSPPTNKNVRVKRNAGVEDTLTLLQNGIPYTAQQTEKIAKVLSGNNVLDTCRNIWNFVYQHIAYAKDEQGKEQVRTPNRTWADRARGVDCDCYTYFIGSILYNLGIPFVMRIADYGDRYVVQADGNLKLIKGRWQHIYPVAKSETGKEIPIDVVLDEFNKEHPYAKKKDYTVNYPNKKTGKSRGKANNQNSELGIDPATASALASVSVGIAQGVIAKNAEAQNDRVVGRLSSWEEEYNPKLQILATPLQSTQYAPSEILSYKKQFEDFVAYLKTEITYGLETYSGFKVNPLTLATGPIAPLVFVFGGGNKNKRGFDKWSGKRKADLDNRITSLEGAFAQLTGKSLEEKKQEIEQAQRFAEEQRIAAEQQRMLDEQKRAANPTYDQDIKIQQGLINLGVNENTAAQFGNVKNLAIAGGSVLLLVLLIRLL